MSNRPKRVNPRPSRLEAQHDQESQAKRARYLIWGALGAIVLIAVVVGVAVASNSGGGGDGVETGFAETFGDPLPEHNGTGNAVGLPAPAFRAQTTQSTEVVDVITDDGTVRTIGFFAHWCPHCQAEVPRVASWLENNDLPAGVELVTVSTSVDQGSPNYPPSSWFEREGWPGDVLSDSDQNTIADAYGLSGFPYWVVVDGDGLVLERLSGELTEADFEAMVSRAAASVS